MKKTLLTLACACLAGSAIAQVPGATDYKGAQFTNLSSDGKWLVESGFESVRVLNSATDEYTEYKGSESQGYYTGIGSCVITNDGVAVGSSANNAVIFKNGEVISLPMLTGQGKDMNAANATTPDGKRIVGYLATDNADIMNASSLMTYPVLWSLKDDGSYECKALPFPEKDFVGLDPQMVLASDISADGKKIIIQITSNDGFYTYPLLLTENADGTWQQQLKGTGKLWDAEKLALIGKAPIEPKAPKATDYFSEADFVTYNKAVEEYNQAVEDYNAGLIGYDEIPANPEYNMGDYISDPTKKAEYAAAEEAFALADGLYWEEYYAFQEKLMGVTYNSTYAFNNAFISANGKYLASTLQKTEGIGWQSKITCTPAVITLDGDKESVKEADLTQNFTSSITNDGMLVHAAPYDKPSRSSYILLPNAEKSMPIDEWLKAEGRDDLNKFLDENYRFTVDKVELDEEGKEIITTVNDSLVSGTCMFTPDGKKMVSFIFDPNLGSPRSYKLDFTVQQQGIDNALADTEIEGEVIAREYFNLQGQRIAAPVSGLYLEKVTTTKGVCTFKRLK